MKFAPEGYPFLAGAGVAAFLAYLVGFPWVALPLLLLTLFFAWFFRDPERRVPEGKGLIVAPADGKVIVVRKLRENEFIKDNVLMISIFMSPLDVHVNRAPCDGRVSAVSHRSGKFMGAFKPEASWENESISMVMETSYGKVLVRQIAGAVARRCVCRVNRGDKLQRGARFGIIKFSSRVDIFLPANAAPRVSPGDRATAGETVIALMPPKGD